MTISEAMAYIQGYQKSGKPVHDLSRIQALLDAIGNPQEQLQVIHIAGTNGKGSVTAFCAAAATAAGFRTGTLTSPFIQHYTDRIQIDGQDIPGEALCRFCEQVKACPVSADCSQFEITFAIALLWFLEQHCDLVVLETGIGGLLDATNVVKAAGLRNYFRILRPYGSAGEHAHRDRRTKGRHHQAGLPGGIVHG